MSKLTGFYSPKEAAEYLRISVDRLTTLLRVEKLPFTDLSEKGDAVPWQRGRKAWGLSGDQLAAIVAARSRRAADADPEKSARELALGQSAMLKAMIPGHDGVRLSGRTRPKPPSRLKPRS